MNYVNSSAQTELSSVSSTAVKSINLPAQLEKVAVKTLPQLEKSFRTLLDTMDDNLFKMAN